MNHVVLTDNVISSLVVSHAMSNPLRTRTSGMILSSNSNCFTTLDQIMLAELPRLTNTHLILVLFTSIDITSSSLWGYIIPFASSLLNDRTSSGPYSQVRLSLVTDTLVGFNVGSYGILTPLMIIIMTCSGLVSSCSVCLLDSIFLKWFLARLLKNSRRCPSLNSHATSSLSCRQYSDL